MSKFYVDEPRMQDYVQKMRTRLEELKKEKDATP